MAPSSAPSSSLSFVVVSHSRRRHNNNNGNSMTMNMDSATKEEEEEVDELSTLTENVLCISSSSEVTKRIFPPDSAFQQHHPNLKLHGQGLYTTSAKDDDVVRTIASSALVLDPPFSPSTILLSEEELFTSSLPSTMSAHPYDEGEETSTAGVPGFPDFAWNSDNGTISGSGACVKENKCGASGLSNWEARRRLDSILAASTSANTRNSSQCGNATRRNHNQQLRRLRRLRRKSVNVMTFQQKKASVLRKNHKHHHEMDDDNNDMLTGGVYQECRAMVVWQPPSTRSKKAIKRQRPSRGSVKGWQHHFHHYPRRQQQQQRLETIVEHHQQQHWQQSANNTSKLGLERAAQQKKEQRALFDLQTGMQYLGL